MSNLKNLTKGRTLEHLSESLVGTNFKVPSLYMLEVNRWIHETEIVHSEICKKFGDCLVVVRSSASDEDNISSAKAGEYESVLGVNVRDRENLSDAISVVVNSYEKKGSPQSNRKFLFKGWFKILFVAELFLPTS